VCADPQRLPDRVCARADGEEDVAEFVTDQDMMQRLRDSGIDYAQGFHVGVPRPSVEIFGEPS
jgi:EAL domain-containing protein (putative c-di-GMP-specific phosphodiesterase class I)